MHTPDVLKYGDRFLKRSIEWITEDIWTVPGACGIWAPKDILAHLASYELLLADVLRSLDQDVVGDTLAQMWEQGSQFNDVQVSTRKGHRVEDVLAEYERAHLECLSLALGLEKGVLTRTGALPWYGEEYDLEDYIVYSSYGHKREHGAQMNLFRDRMGH